MSDFLIRFFRVFSQKSARSFFRDSVILQVLLQRLQHGVLSEIDPDFFPEIVPGISPEIPFRISCSDSNRKFEVVSSINYCISSGILGTFPRDFSRYFSGNSSRVPFVPVVLQELLEIQSWSCFRDLSWRSFKDCLLDSSRDSIQDFLLRFNQTLLRRFFYGLFQRFPLEFQEFPGIPPNIPRGYLSELLFSCFQEIL